MATKLEQLVELKEKYIDTMKNDGKQIITEWLMALAEFIPDLEFFTWVQYTPYFNDGDACEFSVGSLYYFTYSMRDEWKNDPDDSYMADMTPSELAYETEGEYISSYDCDSNPFSGQSSLVKLLDGHDELFQYVFDDHSRIIALPIKEDGKIVGFDYEVTEYEHD